MRKIYIFLFGLYYLLAITAIKHLRADLPCFEHSKYCHYYDDDNSVMCLEFDDFSQLDLTCQDLRGKRLVALYLGPRVRILLNDRLNLESLDFEYKSLIFYNLLGIDVQNTFIEPIQLSKPKLYFQNTTFEFYKNGTKLDNDKDCNQENFNSKTLFTSYSRLSLSNNITYPSQICSYVFEGAEFSDILISSLSDEYPHKLEFTDNNKNKSTNTNLLPHQITVKSVQIMNSNLMNLTNSLLSYNIFKNTIVIGILLSKIDYIDELVFEKFSYLKQVFFKRFDYVENLNRTGGNWIQHINKNLTVFEFSIEKVLKNHTFVYFADYMTEISDNDFCLFRKFPHHHLIVPYFVTKEPLNCSCAIMFLSFQLRFLYKAEENAISSINKCIEDENFYDNLASCKFKERLNECSSSDAGNENKKDETGGNRSNFFDIENYINQMASYEEEKLKSITTTTTSRNKKINSSATCTKIENKCIKQKIFIMIFLFLFIYYYYYI